MSNLFNLFSNSTFRCSVTDCFNCVLHKGMDPLSKAQLIEQFMNVDPIKAEISSLATSTDKSDEQIEFLVKFSKLMNTIGIELIEAFKKVKGKLSNESTE